MWDGDADEQCGEQQRQHNFVEENFVKQGSIPFKHETIQQRRP